MGNPPAGRQTWTRPLQIAFFDSSAEQITSYRKGQLFEKLATRIIDLCGYRDIRLRVKRASLEYDVEATAKLAPRKLRGEAKAHESAIAGKEISAFTGKLLPLAISEGGLDGLFISTSPLTPEGRDYLGTLTPDVLQVAKMTITTLVGQEIVEFLSSHGACIAETSLRAKVRSQTSLQPLDLWFVVGEHGDILVASVGATPASAPTSFITYDVNGERCKLDKRDAARLQKQLADLENLEYIPHGKGDALVIEADTQAVLPGVLPGAGWFDYKFPSPPECFIGRVEPLNEILAYLETVRESRTAARAVQVLSRSGVGKSSLLLKVAASEGPAASVTVDGRNLLTPSDLRLVVAMLAQSVQAATATTVDAPVSQEGIAATLLQIAASLQDASSVATIQIDQFEALLSRPAVFQVVLDLVVTTTERALPIVWIMARKNDLATTYDEGAAVDLTRLNDLSRSIELDDFSPVEEKELLDRLARELGKPVSPQLTEAILTFSAGFPWLLKRVCAHLQSMVATGVEMAQLARGGLRAEDLFNEDLAGLDEADKALLRTLAANLPNTAAELNRRLEGEVSFQRLTNKLNDFLGRKLLRLSGNVYDTYNDVFKSYLLTDRIPFQARYVFRVTPGPVFGLLSRIADEGPVDLASFARRVGGNSTATYNKLRELRLLGFIDPEPGRVALSTEAAAAIETDQIGDFLRRALRANALVSRVLDLVASEDDVDLSSITELLQRQLPHISISSKTWIQYASILVNWLRYAGMVDMEGGRVRQRDSASDEMILRREFNLGNFAPGTFVPSTRPNRVVELLEFVRSRRVTRSDIDGELDAKSSAAVLRDARSLNLVEDGNEGKHSGGRLDDTWSGGRRLIVG